jgi:MFS family permease
MENNTAIKAGPRVSTADLHRTRSMRFLCLAVGSISFALVLQIGLNSNFAVDVMKLSGFQQGLLEAFRESCGIFALGILTLLAGLAEPLIGTVVLIIFGFGLASYAFVHHYFWLVIASLVWSQGLHIWMPLPNSMGLALAEPGFEGRRIAKIQAAGSAGSGVGLALALILTLAGMHIRPLYIFAGVAAILAAGCCLFIPRQIRAEKPRLVMRKEYGLYYLLNFLEGWRKQIFMAFSGYLLVSTYGTPLWLMLVLWMIVNVVGWFSSPAVGRLIDRIGERKVLVFYYSFMTLCFIGYATIHLKYLLYGVYLLDSSFFVFAMALTTYIGRLTTPAEKTLTLSMGVAFNHISAVLMPLIGGLVWKYFGYRWTFIIGAFAAAASIIAAMRVPDRAQRIAVTAQPTMQSALAGGEPE